MIKSTGWLSTVSRRMQPWKALKGFIQSWLPSAGQPAQERKQHQSANQTTRRNLWRPPWTCPNDACLCTCPFVDHSLTTKVKLTSCGNKKRGTGVSRGSFISVHGDGHMSSSGDQLHRVPLTVIQSWAWGHTDTQYCTRTDCAAVAWRSEVGLSYKTVQLKLVRIQYLYHCAAGRMDGSFWSSVFLALRHFILQFLLLEMCAH